MTLVRAAALIAVAFLNASPLLGQSSEASKSTLAPRIALVTENRFVPTSGYGGLVGADVSLSQWTVGLRLSSSSREVEQFTHDGPFGSFHPDEFFDQKSLVVLRSFTVADGQAFKVGVGYAVLSGTEIRAAPSQQECSIFWGCWSSDYHRSDVEGVSGPVAEASYQVRWKDGWAWFPSFATATLRTGLRSSLSGLFLGFGFGQPF